MNVIETDDKREMIEHNKNQIAKNGYSISSMKTHWEDHIVCVVFSCGLAAHGMDEVVMFGPQEKEEWMAGTLGGFCKKIICEDHMHYGPCISKSDKFGEGHVVVAPVRNFPLEDMHNVIVECNQGNNNYTLAQMVWQSSEGLYPFDEEWVQPDWVQPLLDCRGTPEDEFFKEQPSIRTIN